MAARKTVPPSPIMFATVAFIFSNPFAAEFAAGRANMDERSEDVNRGGRIFFEAASASQSLDTNLPMVSFCRRG